MRQNAAKGQNLLHPPGIQGAVNLVPGSFTYAAAARQAANIPQPNPNPSRPIPPRASLMEITVLRFGGNLDRQVETNIRAQPADAITHEVREAIEKVVSNPVRIIAGHWSSGPQSKGNYVYTLAGEIPFAKIQTYKHFFLAPFPGSLQLCPSLGWMKLPAHTVPLMKNQDAAFGPDALLKEVRMLPGLKDIFFAQAP